METNEKKDMNCCEKGWNHHKYMRGNNGGSGAIYCLGVIGAAVYFIGQTTTFWMGALGLLKAFFWPAFLVYKLFGMLLIK